MRPTLALAAIGAIFIPPLATAQTEAITPEMPEIITRNAIYAEAAGLVWIAAELAILYMLIVALRLITDRNQTTNLRLTPQERQRALGWSLIYLLLVAAVLLRQALIPTPAQIQAKALAHPHALTYADIYVETRHFISFHHIIWATFVTIWIILEAAIVVYGYRLYRQLAALLHPGPEAPHA